MFGHSKPGPGSGSGSGFTKKRIRIRIRIIDQGRNLMGIHAHLMPQPMGWNITDDLESRGFLKSVCYKTCTQNRSHTAVWNCISHEIFYLHGYGLWVKVCFWRLTFVPLKRMKNIWLLLHCHNCAYTFSPETVMSFILYCQEKLL
jgi:hypothetical protein